MPTPMNPIAREEFTTSDRGHGKNGATAGIVVITLVVLLGAFYMWNMQRTAVAHTPPAIPFIPGDSTSTPATTTQQ